MTIRPVTLASLKSTKNGVIGNPSAKRSIAQDERFIQTLVECLNRVHSQEDDPQGSQDDIRIEAAHVISSLSYGSEEALASLLHANTIPALLYGIKNLRTSDRTELRSAFARALRAVATAIAEVVGPSNLGLRVQTAETADLRQEAKTALDHLFQLESLDIYLPLLTSSSSQTVSSIAQLLASAVRDPSHRKAVTEWLPSSDRLREGKGKRGWEKPDATNTAPGRHGGWVVRNLCTDLFKTRDAKAQEATLSGIGSLAKNNAAISSAITKPIDKEPLPTISKILGFTKSKYPDVQLAACSCATHILRSCSSHPNLTDPSSVLTIIHVINRMIASRTDSHAARTKACFILFNLVQDDQDMCRFVHGQKSLDKLSDLVKSITPLVQETEYDDEEPESTCTLREAALTSIAAVSVFDHEIRRAVTDELNLIPYIKVSTAHRHVGIRYAACQCVRSLSRGVSVLRTNIVDSGLGKIVFQIFMKDDEDKRVTSVTSMCVCNLVNEFSPLRPECLAGGLLPRLLQLLDAKETGLRINSLWAMKNLLRKSALETKKDVINTLSWERLSDLLADPDAGTQEQALSIARNLAEDESGVTMLFSGLGSEVLLARLTSALDSSESDVVLQATCVLANLVNGTTAQQDTILAHPPILPLLRNCLAANKEIRRPAVACIYHISMVATPSKRKEIAQSGILTTLRHICEWSGAHDVEQDVIEQARGTVDQLEHGGVPSVEPWSP